MVVKNNLGLGVRDTLDSSHCKFTDRMNLHKLCNYVSSFFICNKYVMWPSLLILEYRFHKMLSNIRLCVCIINIVSSAAIRPINLYSRHSESVAGLCRVPVELILSIQDRAPGSGCYMLRLGLTENVEHSRWHRKCLEGEILKSQTHYFSRLDIKFKQLYKIASRNCKAKLTLPQTLHPHYGASLSLQLCPSPSP